MVVPMIPGGELVLAALAFMIGCYYWAKHLASLHSSRYRKALQDAVEADKAFWQEVTAKLKRHQQEAVSTNEWVFKTLLAIVVLLLFPVVPVWVPVLLLVMITPVFCRSIYVSHFAATVKAVLQEEHRLRYSASK